MPRPRETQSRFISEDPIGFAGGDVNWYAYVDSVGKPPSIETNLYRYATGSPVNFTDPFGLSPEDMADTWVNYGTYGANWSEFSKERELGPLVEAYRNGMDKVAACSEAAQNALPEEIRPTGAPYPGFWAGAWRSLLPLRKLLGLP